MIHRGIAGGWQNATAAKSGAQLHHQYAPPASVVHLAEFSGVSIASAGGSAMIPLPL